MNVAGNSHDETEVVEAEHRRKQGKNSHTHYSSANTTGVLRLRLCLLREAQLPLRMTRSEEVYADLAAGAFANKISYTSSPAPTTIALSAILNAGH